MKSIFDPVFASTYNVFFSSLPIIALGIFDQDVNEEMSLRNPILYLSGQKGTLFSFKIFLLSILHGALTSMALFFLTYGSMSNSIHADGTQADDLQTFGFSIATTLVIVVNIQVKLNKKKIRLNAIQFCALFSSFPQFI